MVMISRSHFPEPKKNTEKVPCSIHGETNSFALIKVLDSVGPILGGDYSFAPLRAISKRDPIWRHWVIELAATFGSRVRVHRKEMSKVPPFLKEAAL